MPTTPKVITVRRVISRETIEKLYTQHEISRLLHLSSQFVVKPEAQWFFCVFVFSAERVSPSALKITAISTTFIRTHKYTINPAVLQVAPEITLKEEHNIWVDIIRAHIEAEDQVVHRKMNRDEEMSEYTRFFMDNGAADGVPPSFIVRDLDYEPNPKKKPGLFIVKKPGE